MKYNTCLRFINDKTVEVSPDVYEPIHKLQEGLHRDGAWVAQSAIFAAISDPEELRVFEGTCHLRSGSVSSIDGSGLKDTKRLR